MIGSREPIAVENYGLLFIAEFPSLGLGRNWADYTSSDAIEEQPCSSFNGCNRLIATLTRSLSPRRQVHSHWLRI